jgi:four helix bundle protein
MTTGIPWNPEWKLGIAEGRGRGTDKGFAAFLCQSLGSLYELQTQIELAGDLGFTSKDHANTILADAAEIARMINALLTTLRRQD